MTRVALDYYEIDNEHLYLLWVVCVSCSCGQLVKRLILLVHSKSSFAALLQDPQVPPVEPLPHQLKQFRIITSFSKLLLEPSDIFPVAVQHCPRVLHVRLRADMERVPRDNNLRVQGSNLGDSPDPPGSSLRGVRFDQVLIAVSVVDDVARHNEIEVGHVGVRGVVRIGVLDIVDLNDLAVAQVDLVGFGKGLEVHPPLREASAGRRRREPDLPQPLIELRGILSPYALDDIAAGHSLNAGEVILQDREAEEVIAVRVRRQEQLQGTACGQCALDPRSQVPCGCDTGRAIDDDG